MNDDLKNIELAAVHAYNSGHRNESIQKAADALRRYCQSGKKLNDWMHLSHSQKRYWLARATIVITIYEANKEAEKESPHDRSARH